MKSTFVVLAQVLAFFTSDIFVIQYILNNKEKNIAPAENKPGKLRVKIMQDTQNLEEVKCIKKGEWKFCNTSKYTENIKHC